MIEVNAFLDGSVIQHCSCGVCENVMFRRVRVDRTGVGAFESVPAAIKALEDAHDHALATGTDSTNKLFSRFVTQIMLAPGVHSVAKGWELTFDVHLSGTFGTQLLLPPGVVWSLTGGNQVKSFSLSAGSRVHDAYATSLRKICFSRPPQILRGISTQIAFLVNFSLDLIVKAVFSWLY